MKETLVNLNVNPCKMCMPMGAVTALYGIRKCMTILHGSQGCSTYIRRHMATHYNEPVDIASSSLTEEGTVYGGEKNLVQGLLNLIKLYQPEVIGVATTCLAETIGEDIKRMIFNFYDKYPEYKNITIIPISTAGYGGTQYEGYMEALHQIVRTVPMEATPNNKVNVITSQLSPADTRYLKELLEAFQIDYILLPDLSGNLDGEYREDYQRLPLSGTDRQDIRRMAGAKATIEISTFTGNMQSVAEYLKDTYGVPYYRCNVPISLRDMDELLHILSVASGKQVSDKLKQERGRFLDAMIDGHKYNAQARAVIYGEPDYVYSTVRLCVENGIMPLVTATGTKCEKLKEALLVEIQELADCYYIDRYEILDDVDFLTIEKYAKDLNATLLIGNSDGRRIAEKLGLKLVRRGFPIHDRVGGQRLRCIGYEGALSYLDEISNAVLEVKEGSFREDLYKKYYTGEKQREELRREEDLREENLREENLREENLREENLREENLREENLREENLREEKQSEEILREVILKEESFITVKLKKENPDGEKLKKNEDTPVKTMAEKTASHPCFNCKAHKYSRMHLPIAPKCNISCNYCLRKFDCPNESRPGVTTKVLSPEEAYERFLTVREKVSNLTVVGIAGPGDALANFEETKKTLTLIKERDPSITFCLSTNGLMLPQYAEELIDLGVSHVTVTMNAIDPSIGALIYKHIDYMGTRYYKEAAATILMSNQMAGIKMLTSRGIVCKVNIVMIKGVNDHHIPEVVCKVKELGGTITNIMPMIPVVGSVFEHLEQVEDQELLEMRKRCGETMEQMYHCRQCRADAIGMLGDDRSKEFTIEPIKTLQVAVATKSGMLVDQHFGQVSDFYVYEYNNGKTVFKEKRTVNKYCSGSQDCDGHENKMESILSTISDCKAVIAMRIGDAPKQQLYERGIRVFTTVDRIEDSVNRVAMELLNPN